MCKFLGLASSLNVAPRESHGVGGITTIMLRVARNVFALQIANPEMKPDSADIPRGWDFSCDDHIRFFAFVLC